jgi:hypothetical protein
VLAEYISRLKPVLLLRSVGGTVNRTPAQADDGNRSSSSNAHLEKSPHEHSIAISVLLATFVVALLYIGLLSWYLPINGFWAGDQGAKLIQVQTLLRSRYRDLALPYPGAMIDAAGAFSPVPVIFSWPVEGRNYSIYSYAHAFLTTIPYALFGQFGLHVIPVIATLATMVTAAAISRRLAVRPNWLVPLVIGLTTPLSFYALVLWEHALAVCMTTLAVFCMLKAMEGNRTVWALIGGLAVGLGYWMRNEIIVFAPAVLIGLVAAGGQRRLLLACVGGLIAGITPLLLFNTFLFGLPLGPDVAINFTMANQSMLKGLLEVRLPVMSRLLLDVPDRLWLSVPIVLFGLLASFPLPRVRPWLMVGMAIAIFFGIYNTQPIDVRIGLASTSPLVLLALPVHAHNDPERSALRLLIVTTLVYGAGVLLTAPNDGGYAWGPRYLLPVVPLLSVLSISAITTLLRSSHGFQRWITIGAVVLILVGSTWIQYRSVYLLQQSASHIQRIVQSVDAQNQRIILTDIWYAPQLLGPLYMDQFVFFVEQPEKIAELSSVLRQHQISRLSYVTGQQWWQNEQTLRQAHLVCSSVEKLPMSLELLDCRAAQ